MQNFLQKGRVLELVMPYDRTAGQGVKVGAIFGVLKSDALNTTTGEVLTEGVFALTKKDSQAWSQGDRIYWDDSNKWCSNTNTDGQFIGIARDAVASGSGHTVGNVKLEGVPSVVATQAAITALTDSSTGVSGGNTVPAVTNPDLSGWNGSTDPTAAQATAINAAITALKNDVATLAAKLNTVISDLHSAGITG